MPVLILQSDGTPGVTATEFGAANQQHLINDLALVRLLVSKGIIEPEEYSRAHMQATAEIDQAFAEQRDSVLRTSFGLKTAGAD